MRGYSKVLPQFWIGQTGRRIKTLGLEARLMALYLITSPHATMIGIYYLPVSLISHETDIPIKGASKALENLSEVGFCTYDRAMEYVWVHQMAFYQVGGQLKQNDNRVKSINEIYRKLPKLSFLPEFFKKYQKIFWLDDTEKSRCIEAPPETLLSQEQEQEQEQEKRISSLREEVGNCPHQEIIDLYHTTLPMCPPVRIWNKTRKSYLRQRWAENSKHQTLEWWKNYFDYVKQSAFLTGKVEGRNGKRSFVASLEWLVRPSNFAKVIEGNYHEVRT